MESPDRDQPGWKPQSEFREQHGIRHRFKNGCFYLPWQFLCVSSHKLYRKYSVAQVQQYLPTVTCP